MSNNNEIFIIDFSTVKNEWHMHEIIAEALDFPDYYGCNWDAFWDCLTDMEFPLHIQIIGLDTLKQKLNGADEKLCEILKRLKHYDDDYYIDQIHIDIIFGDNKITLS